MFLSDMGYDVARVLPVRLLQVALLDRMAVHAGMGAKLQDDEGSATGGAQLGAQAREQQAAQAGAWASSSGTWWLAQEEAKQGMLLGLDPLGGDGSFDGGTHTRSKTAGWLEDHHCHVVYATVAEWRLVAREPALQRVVAEAGVPAGPPPLLAARYAARAAEVVCRLCRGEGLGGAYAPAPEWEFAMAQVGTRECATQAGRGHKWRRPPAGHAVAVWCLT